MARAIYPEETKAAVMAALLAGQSIGTIAEEYRIPRGTVAMWASHARRQPVGNGHLGDLIIQNLEAMLTAVKEIVTCVSQDKDWLRKQGASELAVFVGVLSDKAFRILEALPEPEGDGGAGPEVP